MFFNSPPPPPSKPTIVVWVHGTRSSEFMPSFISKLKKKTTTNNSNGLHKIADMNGHPHAKNIMTILGHLDPHQFPLEHAYAFYWSGKLSDQARKSAAHQLVYALKKVVSLYQEQYSCTPRIIIISHSHGGNVVLNMPTVEDIDTTPLVIHKAIFLACPVQTETMHHIRHTMFERVYSLHSHTDIFQIADMQGLKKTSNKSVPLFSERHFNHHPKLAQACIRWKNGPLYHPDDAYINEVVFKTITKSLNLVTKLKKNRGLFHVEFKLLPFIRQIPHIIAHLDGIIDTHNNCGSHKDMDIVIEL